MAYRKKIAIIGSGDLGLLIAHHAEHNCSFDVVGFFDDFQKKGTLLAQNGKVILGNTSSDIQDAFAQKTFDELIIGIGYKHMNFREKIFSQFQGKIPFANVIHPSCSVDSSCVLGEGLFLLPGCVLDKGVVLGNNILLNTGVVIAHDSQVSDHSFLAPGVLMAGFIMIGKRCFLGIGTIVIDNITIESDVQTGGGTVVTKNINSPGLYVGTPAKKIK